MKALVVDDSRAMRGILSQILAESGFEVAQAQHGQEALDHLLAHPDTGMALVDWNMPVMSGLDLVKAVRADDRLSHVLLMMVTTEADMGRLKQAMGAGANEYVMKPFTRDVIVEKLRLLGVEL
jgi:two-component system, chemotaxis family, chemotaxis protein CheY